MLQRKSHTLRGWDAAAEPARFTQQWLKRSLIEGDDLAASQARRSGLVRPSRAVRWLTARTSPALERTLTGHGGGVNAVAVTPGGRRVISASRDGTFKVWDAATGVEERILTSDGWFTGVAAVTPDGWRVISASWTAR